MQEPVKDPSKAQQQTQDRQHRRIVWAQEFEPQRGFIVEVEVEVR